MTVNYGVKQSQFTKSTLEPALVILKNLMSPLIARLEDGYCSITIANHRLITVISFVAKSYTHFLKKISNKFYLVFYAYEISFFFLKNAF